MSLIDTDTLARIAGGSPDAANMAAVVAGLDAHGRAAGLDQPARLACYLGQLCHESAGFRYDREIWGPTPAQARYDGRTDLGNTAALDGDGFLYRGRGPIQITGKANYRAFRDWARTFSRSVPDFVAQPDALLTDPWEGLAPVWFWQSRDLNRYADQGDIEMITRRINGGLNGYADRLSYYTRAALVLLGHAPDAVRAFQADAGLTPDGIAGPRTRAALHARLLKLPPVGAPPRASGLCAAIKAALPKKAA